MLKLLFATVGLLLVVVTEAHFGPGSPNRFGGPFGFDGRPGFSRPPGFSGPPGPVYRPRPRPFPFPFPFPFPRPRPRPRPQPQPQPRPTLTNLTLCTYTQLAQDKCLYAVQAAANSSIDLKLQCLQADSYDACISSVQSGAAHLVVADDHQYKVARAANLTPVLFAHELLSDYYVAVAPRNITLVELDEATIEVDSSDHDAFHAAAFFNLQRGHDICRQYVVETNAIKIVNTADYTANEDEILICANRSVAEWDDYSTCNVDADLEYAVFAAKPLADDAGFKCLVQKTFDTLIEQLGSENEDFNFFADFQNTSDLIFKNNTISFSEKPIIRNGVTEEVFNQLHCNTDDQVHDPSQLE